MHTSRILTTSAALAAVAVLASACGSSGSSTTAPDTASGSAGFPAAADQSGMRPGASGTIAAVDGKVVQVQNDSSGQVAVTITSTTTITDQVKASRSAVKVGTCVVVRPSGTSSSSTAVTASSVSVTAASGSSCTNGFGGGPGGPGGTMPSGAPRGMPTDMPTDMPSGMPSNGGGMGFGVMGKVTAVSSKDFTVASSMPGSTGSSTSVTVTTTGSTTYTAREKASLSALTVGRCLQATGATDSTGAVTATRASVSDAVNGSCTTGFGGGQRGSAS